MNVNNKQIMQKKKTQFICDNILFHENGNMK
jgi:hypothetical protein